MYSNISLKQFCSATSNIPPLCKSFANVWRHFCLLQFEGGRAAMAKDIVNTPTKHRVMIPQERTNLPKMLNGTEVELKYKNYQHTPNKHLACILCKLYFREKKSVPYFLTYGQKQGTGNVESQLRNGTLTALSMVSIDGTFSENVTYY